MSVDLEVVEPLSGRPCKWRRNSLVLLPKNRSKMFTISEPSNPKPSPVHRFRFWFRRHILTYWKSWIVIFSPLLLLPLCVVINSPVINFYFLFQAENYYFLNVSLL